ncbi:MAG TPA: S8 family serine peptidase [Flavobacteriales bacterium]
MHRLITLFAFLGTTLLPAQVRLPATTQVGLAEIKAIAQRIPDARRLTEATQGLHPTALLNGRCMVGFLGRVQDDFDPAAVDPAVVHLGAQKGTIRSFRIDAHHLDVLNSIPGLVYAELAGKVAPHLDRLVKATRADSVQRGIMLPQSYTGRDVLIGVLDWGFDYSHPMFYDTLMTATRVHAAWDQFRQAGPAPDGFGYGTELSTPEDLLATGADTANIYSFATHGSHVAGIAGGGGAGTAYRGIAFDAQYLFCTFLVDAAAVMDAFEWMNIKAQEADKRLVVNMSWGLYYIGTLDGNSLLSQVIDAWSDDGIAFVNSGGNNGDIDFHIRKDFEGDTLRSLVQFYPYSAHPSMWGQSLSMWGEPDAAFSVSMRITGPSLQTLQETPWYGSATQPAYLDSFVVQGADTVYFNLTTEAAHPLNGRPHFRLRVKNRSTALRVVLQATAESGTVHCWNVTELSNGVGNWGQAFQAGIPGWTAGDHAYGISEPACTRNLIAVAAYTSEYTNPIGNPAGGAGASFSSYGPTMDERIKPDIAAPGVNVASSISSYTDNAYTAVSSVDFQGRNYPFARFSGTSMSAPAVTGIVALMLEADPDITPAGIKDVLQATARTDQYTGVIPPGGSTRWGAGKVNAYRAVVEMLGVASVQENIGDGPRVWPVPANQLVNIAAAGQGPVDLVVLDVTGRTVHTWRGAPQDWITLDVSDWPAGVYFARLQQDGGTWFGQVVRQ